ncbi:uncharacterized protein LOC111398132 [Olea europaea var. sylvestris]|uniref:uncharacterized protein LOC111398132 n=1 Tax=Olea europaea var. sylvestris TaxID=158386 RepID=UPI000C1D8825|nr:uncharacterized protein LOC111398132 [Olea europaea var. sylvestris]
MASFEALYGRKCRTPVCWDEVGERKLLGPEYVQITADKVKIIKEKLKIAQDRQKNYADRRRRNTEFDVGDRIFLQLSPWKGVIRFGKQCKLSTRYIGPYEIVEHIDLVAYRLAFPTELSIIHDVFHVSILRKYIPDPYHVLKSQLVELKENLTYVEEPVQILERKKHVLRSKTIPLVKVLWMNHAIEEVIWESEEQMRSQYPQIFRT